MSANFEVNAQLAAYAHVVGEDVNEPIYDLLGAVASGNMEPGEAAGWVGRLAPVGVVDFTEWARSPEAAAAIEQRVQLQEAYAATLAEPVRDRIRSGRPALARPGSFFVPFDIEVGG